MSLQQFRQRGQAFRCVRCSQVDRKGRMISHVLKHHAPFNRVPYSCSMCSFRCTDKKTLLDHIKKYSKHRDEEAKFGQPDYTKVLRMASNPYQIGEEDMVQFRRDESLRLHGRHSTTQSENLMDDIEGLFKDEEDEVVMPGGVPFPGWFVTGDVLTSNTNDATCRFQPDTVVDKMSPFKPPQKQEPQLLIATKLHTGKVQHSQSTKPSVLMHRQSQFSNSVQTVSCSQSAVPLNLASQSYNISASTPSTIANGLSTINPYDMISSINQGPGLFSTVLNTPQLFRTSTDTPLMDRNHYSILPQLQIQETDRSDPLYKEAVGLEPSPKRQKLDNESSKEQESSTTSDENNLADVIMRAAKFIADAINSNTRAVRNNIKGLDRITAELGRIDRKVHFIERSMNKEQENNKENKGNVSKEMKKQALKSVVLKTKAK